jgi:hypothetical protein
MSCVPAAQEGSTLNNRKLRLVGALGALVALTAVGVGGTASAEVGARGEPAPTTIKMKGDRTHEPKFVGPQTVVAGTDLRIVNRSSGVGPHTFSLVEKDALPQTRSQFKKCFNLELICGEVLFGWHDLEFTGGSFTATKVREALALGWDTMGTRGDTPDDFGDSWFTRKKGTSDTRTTSAADGTTLRYFCAVHPFMRGKIDVVPSPAP